ncbi:Arm DNA-binding domain-containing protein [Paenibacillus sp. 1P07SE]|uniref:Arm DNA-binding domain-containing protein n=1 Tax=Paenibacillus sp. 1P07SE TaxID=3132209 RepID=UPI0039A52821
MGKNREGKRRQKSKGGYESKVDAEKALQKVLHELNPDTYIEPTKDDKATFFTSWLAQKQMNIRPGTYKTYRWLVNYHIIPQLGQIKMVNLSPQHLAACASGLQAAKSDCLHKQSTMSIRSCTMRSKL